MTELVFLRDAELRVMDAKVTAVDGEGNRVALDRTAFYATGGDSRTTPERSAASRSRTFGRRGRRCGTPSTVTCRRWGSRCTATSTGSDVIS
ncbi:MAG TPA: hypothetical protein VJM33_11820 [Microthrixaceae bacterium]|nr:hypothetical protein [Microthrixaceae bacterium]